MKTLKERFKKCKDSIKENGQEWALLAIGGCITVLGVLAFKRALNNWDSITTVPKVKIDASWKPYHCVEFESTTLGTALEAIDETFKDVDKDTKVFALVYDNIKW